MSFEYRAPGATLKRFYESDGFARALLGPIYGGRKTAAVFDILGRLSEGRQKAWRWAVVRASDGELRAETIACWQEHFSRVFGLSAATPKIWDAKDLTARVNTKAGLLEVRFFGLDTPAMRRAFDTYPATAYWLDGARDLPESVFDQAIGGAGEWPSRLQGGCTWRGVVCTSRMPMTDHWLARRFGAVPQDRGAQLTGTDERYRLFWQPAGRSPRAENLVHLKDKGVSYHGIARDKPDDWVRQYVDAEFAGAESLMALKDEADQARDEIRRRLARLAEEAPAIAGAPGSLAA